MKISDITEAYVTEKPANLATRAAAKLGQYNPFSAKGRARAKGMDQTAGTANTLWKYYQQQLGRQGEEATADNLKNFFTQKPYNVDPSIIDAAFKAAGIDVNAATLNASVQEVQKGSKQTKRQAQRSGNAPRPGQEPQQQEPAQQSEPLDAVKLNDKQVDAVFKYVVAKAPQNFASGNQNSIPSDVIDAVKKLKPAQRQTLGKTLLGQQTNV